MNQTDLFAPSFRCPSPTPSSREGATRPGIKARSSWTLNLLLTLSLGLGSTGCSFMMVHRRFTEPSPSDWGDGGCTHGYNAPLVDTGVAVGTLAGMAVVSALEAGPKSDAQTTALTAYQATTGALAGVFLVSALYGFSNVSKCNRADDAVVRPLRGAVVSSAPTALDAAGFRLGSSPVEAREACSGSGRVWGDADGGVSTCVGPAKPPIGAGTTWLYFKATRLSVVEADVKPPGSNVETWSGAYRDLQRTLKERHGAPVDKNLDLPEKCKASTAFMQCLADGKIRGATRWDLHDGTTVLLSVAPEHGVGIIRVRFSAQDATAAGPKAKKALP